MVQLITEFGLQYDMDLAHGQRSMGAADIAELTQLRKNIFWAAFMMDTYVLTLT